MSEQVSPQFIQAVRAAIERAKSYPDEAVPYMVSVIPVWAAPYANQAMAEAGGCPNCTYLGLWASNWPGYQASQHGIIFLFDNGISQMGGDLVDNAYKVLLHEFDHALQRDHVLDALATRKRLALSARGCAVCPGQR